MSDQPINNLCPACSKPLSIACENGPEGQKWIAWCANGLCINQAANNGGEGVTKQAAIDDCVNRTERDL